MPAETVPVEIPLVRLMTVSTVKEELALALALLQEAIGLLSLVLEKTSFDDILVQELQRKLYCYSRVQGLSEGDKLREAVCRYVQQSLDHHRRVTQISNIPIVGKIVSFFSADSIFGTRNEMILFYNGVCSENRLLPNVPLGFGKRQ